MANAHVALIEIWIAFTVLLNYYNNFDSDSAVLVYGPIFRSIVWFASAITSIWLMFRDTAYWRSLTELSSAGSTHNPDEEVKNGDAEDSDHGPALGPTLMRAFRQAHASVFIDFGLLSVKQRIESGGRSEVYLGTYKGEKVALKVFRPKQITDLMVRQWSHEIELTLSLVHPNVIRCFGVSIIAPKVAVVFEYCQRNLTDYVTRYPMNPLMVVALMLDYRRRRGVPAQPRNHTQRHQERQRDGLSMPRALRGQADRLWRESPVRAGPMTVIGTPHYIAPEMLELIPDSSSVARATYDEKVDVFSMAVVFWEVMHREKHLSGRVEHIGHPLAVRHGYRPSIEPGILDQFPEIVGLITQMWAREPHNRPSSKRVLAFLEEYQLAVLRDIISRAIRPPHSCTEFADMLMARAIMTRRLEALKWRSLQSIAACFSTTFRNRSRTYLRGACARRHSASRVRRRLTPTWGRRGLVNGRHRLRVLVVGSMPTSSPPSLGATPSRRETSSLFFFS